jgi:hypothetical protein
MIRLFITAYLQVALVSANTWFVAQGAWAGVAVCSFGISYVWTLNVKKISASTTMQRIAYSSGAMLGGLTGMALSMFISKTKLP